MEDKYFLEHYGIKGMRWGFRKQKKFGTKVLTLRKGTEIHRLANDLEKHSGHAYASYKKDDVMSYRAFLGRPGSFDLRYTLKESLISPSERTRVETAVKLMINDPVIRREVAEYAKNTRILKFIPMNIDKKADSYTKLNTNSKKDKAYMDFSCSLVTSEKNRKAYIKELQRLGYNMVIDDSDARTVTSSPIIIFDRGRSLNLPDVTKLTQKDIEEAWAY
jgi:hypothetical protein